jgi:hypothetical protein
MNRGIGPLFAAIVAFAATSPAPAELSGEFLVEGRLFPNDPLDARQQDAGFSFAIEPEYYHDWSDGGQRLVVVPFARWDLADTERTHFDMREFYWRRSFDNADFYVGVRKVFWGVTESVHLVDVINQTDLVENPDTEDKLGQPMLQLTLLRDQGTLDLFIMTGFRERSFAGGDGRFRPSLSLAGRTRYESELKRWHPDVAARWSQILGDYDLGVSHFFGTSREPRFVVDGGGSSPRLVPHYDLLHQTGIDLQFTRGDWLAKLEAVYRNAVDGGSTAFVAGVEYTLVGLVGAADLGIVAEGQYDNRDAPLVGFSDNDLAVGGRLTFNDIQDTDVLAFTGVDGDNGSLFSSIEANRRWRDAGEIRVEARFFSNVDSGDPLYAFRRDDYLQLEYVHFF